MAQRNNIPYFLRPRPGGGGGQPVGSATCDHHDLLAFLSIASKYQVDFFPNRWEAGLPELGGGATSVVAQGSVDIRHGLAFKRPSANPAALGTVDNTEHWHKERWRSMIHELVALESLRDNPYVVNVLGLSWEAKPESEEIWPVFLTERSHFGSLGEFLSSDLGKNMPTSQKLKLCGDVAKACHAMHGLGIIHGDIKPENVLVFAGPDGDLRAKMIDFGYSCFGLSASALVKVPRTRPYQAPEHCLNKSVPWESAQKMDIFSFGFILCRVLIWEDLVAALGITGDLSSGQTDEFLDHLDKMKCQPQFLEIVITAVESSDSLTLSEKLLGCELLRLTLCHDATTRVRDFGQVVSILDPDYELISGVQIANIDELSRHVLEIGDVLDDLDQLDYLVGQALFQDLKYRATSHVHCVCFQGVVKQLSLCYEIGLGVRRNQQIAARWRPKCTTDWDLGIYFKNLNARYESRYLYWEDRISQLVAYSTAAPIALVDVYREQNRLDTAETICRQELEGRKQSLGAQSRSYLAQLLVLSSICIDTDKKDEAIQTVQLAASTLKETYGLKDLGTIGAYNYLSHILFRASMFEEVEKVQLELIKAKESLLGGQMAHRTHATSRLMLTAAYYYQGRYDECLSTARDLLQIQLGHLDKRSADVLETRSWICLACLAKGQMDGLLESVRDIVKDHEATYGESEETLIERELLSRVLLAMAKPEPSTQVVDSFLDESLKIIVGVLDKIEDPNGTDDSSVSTTSDVVMDDIDDRSEERPLAEDGQNVAASVNLTLMLTAHTTFICGVAFKSDFDSARKSVEFVGRSQLLLHFPESNVELRRYRRVVHNLCELESLVSDTMVDHTQRINELLWELAHRQV